MQSYNINIIPLSVDSIKIIQEVVNKKEHRLFEKEAEFIGKVSHPNIIRYIERF
jgi:serine/threonine protein kinase